jgi:hypothetical protein
MTVQLAIIYCTISFLCGGLIGFFVGKCFRRPVNKITTPKPDSDPAKLEYAKMWMEQSKVMWSRLQFIHLMHVGVWAGWFTLVYNRFPPYASETVLALGPIFSIFFAIIISRDGKYMDELRTLSDGAVPQIKTLCFIPNGRRCAYLILIVLSILEIATIVFSRFPSLGFLIDANHH